MNRIEHEADDSKLSKAIDQYNDRLAEHQATAEAIRQPPSVSDDESGIFFRQIDRTTRVTISEKDSRRLERSRFSNSRAACADAFKRGKGTKGKGLFPQPLSTAPP